MARIESPNLIVEPSRPPEQPIAPRRVLRRSLRMLRTASIVVAVAFLVLSWTTRSSNPNVLRSLGESATVRSLLSLLRSPSSILAGEREDRINILLLGIGGEGHDGPLLTDTILIASIQPSVKRVTLISVPRDLFVPIANGRYEKANAINAYAERGNGGGAETVRDALAATLGVHIPYYVRVDFAGFSGLIDAIGGVVIDVERALDDPQYPINGKESAPWSERFERLVIPAGSQRMDGALALKYVRSRHALGVEGSDFARARRQQHFLLAIRDRILSRGLLANPRYFLALLDTWRNHVYTNLTPPELLRLSTFAPRIATDAVSRVVFSDGPQGELVAGFAGDAYVLRPRDGSFEQMRAIVQRAFNARTAQGGQEEDSRPASLSVEIWNGTNVNGLASATAEALQQKGLIVRGTRNAPTRTVDRTIIYYQTRVPNDLVTALRDMLHADTSTAFPSLGVTTSDQPDLLIVLGASSVAQR